MILAYDQGAVGLGGADTFVALGAAAAEFPVPLEAVIYLAGFCLLQGGYIGCWFLPPDRLRKTA